MGAVDDTVEYGGLASLAIGLGCVGQSFHIRVLPHIPGGPAVQSGAMVGVGIALAGVWFKFATMGGGH